MSGPRRTASTSGVALLEEVFQIAKALPLPAWAIYFGSTFPFVLAFLYFWADMANNAFAQQRIAIEAAGLSVLFVIAKIGHTLFCRQVLACVTGEVEIPRPRLVRVAINQTILQSTGLLVLPLCLIVIAPFGFAYAMYQSATALDDGSKGVRELIRDARKQASLNPAQSNVMLWLICPYAVPLAAGIMLLILPVMRLVSPEWTNVIFSIYAGILALILVPLSPFGIVVAINLAAALVLLPGLLKTLFGIETMFSISPSGMFSPAFATIVSGMTYLCLDPLVKIAYTLRCFYGDSVHTGKDLKIKIARIAQAGALALIAAAALTSAPESAAQTPAARTGDEIAALDRAIDRTLQDPRFAWRLPRQRPEAPTIGFVQQILDSISDTADWFSKKIDAFMKWLDKLFSGRPRNRAEGGGVPGDVLRGTAAVLLAALFAVLVFVAWKTWRKTTVVETTPVQAQALAPDLEDEGTTADALASSEWLRLARELLAQGQVRLAMRAYFFAGLARLAQLHFVRLAASKSNREYVRELGRVTHARAELVGAFSANLRVFEAVWYGDHDIDSERLHAYIHAQEGISGE